MCGRYTLDQVEALRARFMAENDLEGFGATYNAAPGQYLPVVTRNSPNRLELMRWGLVPSWADDPKVGYKMINARGETVAEKPSFRSSFRSRRCLVPVTGYYEWKREGSRKQPFYYRLRDGGPFALAGLSAEWHDADGNELRTYTIITTAANELAAEVHDRMPVILPRDAEDAWLDREAPLAHVQSLLRPFDAGRMEAYPVSSRVNSPQINEPALVDPDRSPSPDQGARNSA